MPVTVIRSRFIAAKFLTFAIGILVSAIATPQEESPTALSGFTVEELFDIDDFSQFDVKEQSLQRLLFRVQSISDRSFGQYSKVTKDVSQSDVYQNPRDFRGLVFRIHGRAKYVRRIESSSETRLSVFAVGVQSDDGSFGEVLIPIGSQQAPPIPNSWPLEQEIDEPIRCSAFFLALRDNEGASESLAADLAAADGRVAIFVAPRIEWFPDSGTAIPSIGPSQLLLSQHDVDIGLLKNLPSGGPLTAADSKTMFQLLRASTSIQPDQLPEQRSKLTDILRSPGTHTGSTMSLTATAKRVSRIEISDRDWAREIGQDHYFQIDLMVPLDGQRVVIQSPESAGDQQPLEFDNRFPVSVCVLKLPTAPSEMESRLIAVQGFFFRNWSYESEYSKSSASFPQVSPLVIGLEPVVGEPAANHFNRAVGVFALAVAIGFVLLALFLIRDSRTKHSR